MTIGVDRGRITELADIFFDTSHFSPALPSIRPEFPFLPVWTGLGQVTSLFNRAVGCMVQQGGVKLESKREIRVNFALHGEAMPTSSAHRTEAGFQIWSWNGALVEADTKSKRRSSNQNSTRHRG
jgi:hypothetical protein